MDEVINDIRYEIITNKDKLFLYKKPILDLFEQSFQKTLPAKLWDWAYLDNVCGDPIVSLAFDQDRLIGHYAVIPIRLKNSTHVFKSSLSMTTMVDSNYRGKGLFVTQAKQVYNKIMELDFDLVVGFPNSNSVHGFKKHLEWNVKEPAECIISVTKKQLAQSQDLRVSMLTDNVISLDVTNHDFLQWRLAKPGHAYEKIGSCIVKKFQNAYDIVYLGKDYLQDLNDNEQYNLLIDSNITDLVKYKISDYHYGYRYFSNRPTELIFKKDLLISDVF